MHTRVLGLGLFFVLSVSGCAAGEAVGCDFREGGVNGEEDRCQERSGLGAAIFASSCETLQGKVVEGGCPREGIVAGCLVGQEGDGSDVIDWFYDPMTREDVELHECSGDELVEP